MGISTPTSIRRGLAALESTIPPGQMTPLHAHAEDEAIAVIGGSATVYSGEQAIQLEAGEELVVPAHELHAVRAGAGGVRIRSTTVVRCSGRYEDFLHAVAAPLPASALGCWPCVEEATSLASLAAIHDIRLAGPPGTLPAASAEPGAV